MTRKTTEYRLDSTRPGVDELAAATPGLSSSNSEEVNDASESFAFPSPEARKGFCTYDPNNNGKF